MAATRKLYTEMAKSFRASVESRMDGDTACAVAQTIRLISGDLVNDNPRFDEAKFWEACGLTAEGLPKQFA